jgi:hypothetical protein
MVHYLKYLKSFLAVWVDMVQCAWACVVDPEARQLSNFTYENGNGMSVREARLYGFIPSKEEQYGNLIPSTSGTVWYLGRRVDWHVPSPKHPDSRELLEHMGFRILGLVDQMRYAVEPPPDWCIKPLGPLHFKISDAEGKVMLVNFEKQESWEFRAFVFIPKD